MFLFLISVLFCLQMQSGVLASTSSSEKSKALVDDAMKRLSIFNYTDITAEADEWIFFFTQEYGHSKRATPIMRRVARRLERIESPVRVGHIKCSAQDMPLCRSYNIMALPTILFKERNGETTEYRQKREFGKLLDWILERQPAVNAEIVADLEAKQKARAEQRLKKEAEKNKKAKESEATTKKGKDETTTTTTTTTTDTKKKTEETNKSEL